MVNFCEVDEASAAGSLPIVENSGPTKARCVLGSDKLPHTQFSFGSIFISLG